MKDEDVVMDRYYAYFIYKKGANVEEDTPIHILMNSCDLRHYTASGKNLSEIKEVFIERCKQVIVKNKEYFTDLNDGYVRVVRIIEYGKRYSYGVTPLFVTLNAKCPDERLFETESITYYKRLKRKASRDRFNALGEAEKKKILSVYEKNTKKDNNKSSKTN